MFWETIRYQIPKTRPRVVTVFLLTPDFHLEARYNGKKQKHDKKERKHGTDIHSSQGFGIQSIRERRYWFTESGGFFFVVLLLFVSRWGLEVDFRSRNEVGSRCA
jgi:hypothetical protein